MKTLLLLVVLFSAGSTQAQAPSRNDCYVSWLVCKDLGGGQQTCADRYQRCMAQVAPEKQR